MTETPLYPLRFQPIYQYRPWGGRRLADLLSAPLPGDGPIGEAWLLSDRDDHPSLVADGPLKGKTIGQILKESPENFLGNLAGHYARFPVLLKFLDVQETLSVQVHPSDAFKDLSLRAIPEKRKHAVVLEKGPEARIYAGLKPDTTPDVLRRAITNGTVADRLASFAPRLGDAVFIRAGTVHALSDVVVFEIQEKQRCHLSSIRLGPHRSEDLVSGGLSKSTRQWPASISRKELVCAVTPQIHEQSPLPWEKLIHCDHFGVWRISGEFPVYSRCRKNLSCARVHRRRRRFGARRRQLSLR